MSGTSPKLNSPELIRNLEDAFSTAFQSAFDATNTVWQKFAMTQNFDAAGLVLGWLDQIEDLREWLGDRELRDIDAYGYRVAPKNFERTVGIDVNDINDTIIANTANVMRAIGEAAKRHPQKLLKQLLKEGHQPTALCYNGQSFFAETHPFVQADGTAGTFSNIVKANGSTKRFYLVKGDGNGETSVVKPFVFGVRTGQDYTIKTHGGPSSTLEFMKNKVAFGVDARVAAAYGLPHFAACSEKALTKDSLQELAALMGAIPGNKGAEIDNTPNLLIVDEEDRFAAEEIINTQMKASTSNIHYKRYEILVLKGLKG